MPAGTPTVSGHAKSPYIWGLDPIRFVAAALVASMHLWASQPDKPGTFLWYLVSHLGVDTPPDLRLPPFAFVGGLGVQIFFVISGLVITQSTETALSVRSFLTHRFLRLFPTLLICTCVGTFLAIATGYYSPMDALARFIRSILLLPFGDHIDNVVWTLTLECVFYGASALCLFLGRRSLLPLAVGLSVTCGLFWAIWLLAGCGTDVASFACRIYENRWFSKVTLTLLVQHGSFFSLGMAIHGLSRNYYDKRWWWIFIGSASSCYVQVFWLSTYYAVQFSATGAQGSPTFLLALWTMGICAIAASCAIARVGFAPSGKAGRALRAVGLISYPLYLLHVFVGMLFGAIAIKCGFISAAPLIGFGAAICASLIVMICVEPPVRRLFEQRNKNQDHTNATKNHSVATSPLS